MNPNLFIHAPLPERPQHLLIIGRLTFLIHGKDSTFVSFDLLYTYSERNHPIVNPIPCTGSNEQTPTTSVGNAPGEEPGHWNYSVAE
ncbi:hypothetical protein RRF57_002124 [Xylaria bambusicola]|uniref:Uncharacterized protein n=1 Tax=Xylaria bambusicola TaxID=326684 RepID=A0AAN7UCJ5_9PEZI